MQKVYKDVKVEWFTVIVDTACTAILPPTRDVPDNMSKLFCDVKIIVEYLFLVCAIYPDKLR